MQPLGNHLLMLLKNWIIRICISINCWKILKIRYMRHFVITSILLKLFLMLMRLSNRPISICLEKIENSLFLRKLIKLLSDLSKLLVLTTKLFSLLQTKPISSMLSLNLEMILDSTQRVTLKRFLKYVITSEILKWLTSTSDLKIRNLENLHLGNINLRRYWLQKERRKYKTNWRNSNNKKRSKNKSSKKYLYFYHRWAENLNRCSRLKLNIVNLMRMVFLLTRTRKRKWKELRVKKIRRFLSLNQLTINCARSYKSNGMSKKVNTKSGFSSKRSKNDVIMRILMILNL